MLEFLFIWVEPLKYISLESSREWHIFSPDSPGSDEKCIWKEENDELVAVRQSRIAQNLGMKSAYNALTCRA